MRAGVTVYPYFVLYIFKSSEKEPYEQQSGEKHAFIIII